MMDVLLRALQYAAQQHTLQRRKGGHDIPYINHPIDVATQLATVGGVTDVNVLSAALLHDTVEDTDSTHEDLVKLFGSDIADLVVEVTDAPNQSNDVRRERQVREAAAKSPRAKLIRLADKTCNVRDITHRPPPTWSADRRRAYFLWAESVVDALGPVNAALESDFARALSEAKKSIQ